MKFFTLQSLSMLFLILSAHFSYEQVEAQVVNDDCLRPKEFVYMHFDNDDYLIGEDIFFKAYIINSLATKSGVLYTELLSSNGDIIEKKKHKIENGCCEGYFAQTSTEAEMTPSAIHIHWFTPAIYSTIKAMSMASRPPAKMKRYWLRSPLNSGLRPIPLLI